MKLRSLMSLLLCVAASSDAFAFDYPADLSSIDTEEDIYDLYYEGQLEESDLEKLLSILQDPVDINTADRDHLYSLPGLSWGDVDKIIKRRDKTPFDDPGELSTLIDPEAVQQLLSFAKAGKPFNLLQKLSGKAQLKVGWRPANTIYSVTDEQKTGALNKGTYYAGTASKDGTKLPTASLKLETKLKGWFDLGVILTESQELGELKLRKFDENAGSINTNTTGLPVFYDSSNTKHDANDIKSRRSGYLTDGIGTKFDLAKIYIHTPVNKGKTWSAILGSYRIGFGMGTVIDNTGREFPNGWRADKQLSDSASANGSAPNFRDDPGFFGGAVSLHRLPVGNKHWLSGHVFGSRIDRNSYQVLQNKVNAEDYNSKATLNAAKGLYICEKQDGACRYRYNPATGENNYKASQVTILDAFRETTFGGNFNFHLNPVSQIGVSGYASKLDMSLLDSENGLELAASSPYPYHETTFGAVGGHLFYGIGDFMLRSEYARSINGTEQGNGLQVRGYYGRGILDAEIGFRYYDENFDNRWTSGKAAGDMLDGNRARDEMGFDYRIAVKPFKGLQLQLKGDLWQRKYAQCVIKSSDDPDADGIKVDESCVLAQSSLDDGQKLELGDPIWNTTQAFTLKYAPLKMLSFALRTSYSNKDLSNGGRDETYDDRGQKWTVNGQINYQPFKWLKLSAAYNHAWRDDNHSGVFNASKYNAHLDGQNTNYLYVDQVTQTNYDVFDRVLLDETSGKYYGKNIYANQYAQDHYWWVQATAKYDLTTFTAKFKMYEEDIGFDSIGESYWLLSFKIAQAKTWEHVAASLRYDLINYTDDRSKWYERDQRYDIADPTTAKYRNDKLLSRMSHLLIGTLTVSF